MQATLFIVKANRFYKCGEAFIKYWFKKSHALWAGYYSAALLLGLLCLNIEQAKAQCALYELSLSDRVAKSAYIFEGVVTAQNSFWDSENRHIYTINKIKVFKDFTQNANDEMYLLTQGGTVDEISEVVSPNLNLNKGNIGIFFANVTSNVFGENFLANDENGAKYSFFKKIPLYLSPHGGAQGFIRYEQDAPNRAVDFYRHYSNVCEQIYYPIVRQKGHVFRELAPKEEPVLPKQLLIPTINALSPETLRAGMGDTLYISGSGFGTFSGQATVMFRNPDYYGFSVSYQSVQAANIVTWTDTEIVVVVPGRDIAIGSAGAGTGSVRVKTFDGVLATSAQTLTVLSNRHVHNSFTKVNLSNDNGTGGYTFTCNTIFNANTAAKNAFQRALQTWTCSAMTNFTMSSLTTALNCPANDNTNLISFDTNCLLPEGTLAQTTQWFSSCTNGDKYYFEIDVIFSSATAWNYGPTATGTTQKDFESIALHELGHAQGMGHVLNYGKIMYPSLSAGVDIRQIDADAMSCVQDITARSRLNNGCGTSTYIPITTCGIKTRINAFLQGTYNATTGTMNTQLANLLPLTQPFNQAPWNYNGTETIGNNIALNNVVDWVLLEARTTPNAPAAAQKAALLAQDGTIIGTDGSIGVNFSGLTAFNTPYYIIVRPRNHLAVMSQNAITLPNSIALDFSNINNIRGLNQAVLLIDGKYALFAGDGDGNGIINVFDFNLFRSQIGTSPNQYLKGDYTLNGSVTIDDFNIYRPNATVIGIGDIRY